MATRRSRITLWSSLASIRRISRFLPSASTIFSQVLSPCRLSRLTNFAFTRPSREPDAGDQLPQVRRVRLAGDLHVVGLLDAEARVHQLLGQVAVVGQQQQALAVLVEPADGVDALIDVRDQVEGQRPAGGVVVGAEVAARLVDRPVDVLLGPDGMVVDGDLVRCPDRRGCRGRGRSRR